MHVIRRCECSAEIFVQCSGLNFEICMECKGLRTSSHHNIFEDMKFTPYLVPNSLLRDAPDYSMYTTTSHTVCLGVSRRSAQATTGNGLYVAARAGVEPTTLRLKVIVSTKAPPRPTQ